MEFFLQKKSQQVDLLLRFIKSLKEDNKKVKFGRKQKFEEKNRQWGLNILFEFTARQTPQQNGKVERAFATLYGRMRAMMLSAGFDNDMKKKLWMKVAATATKLDNIMSEKGQKSPHFLFYKRNPEYENHLRVFGEYGIDTTNPRGAIRSKLEDHGMKCMFLGYAANHTGNVYRMLT